MRCQSLIICGRLVTVDDAGVGGGAGGRAECRVMMYWCHLSSFFTQAWYITSHPAQLRTATHYSVLWSGKLNDTGILRRSGYSECSCVMSSFSTTSPRDTIENIRHFLSDETRLILSAPTFYSTHIPIVENANYLSTAETVIPWIVLSFITLLLNSVQPYGDVPRILWMVYYEKQVYLLLYITC